MLSDTDRYVETVAPIAEDPGVQAETLDSLAENENLPSRVAATLPAHKVTPKG